MPNTGGSLTPLVARVMLSSMFLWSGLAKVIAYSTMVGYAASKGIPLAGIAVACAAVIEILGGLAVITGFHTRVVAWVLFVYLIPTTIVFHNYWALQGAVRLDTQTHFMKNLAIMGGLLLLAHFGAGDFAFDSTSKKGS
ncbi:MAG: DoxX family protein [Candidatus Acidiferrales bacterium]